MKPTRMRTKTIYLEQGRQPPSLALGRESKAGMRVGKLCSGKEEKKEGLQVCPDWRLQIWNSFGQAN